MSFAKMKFLIATILLAACAAVEVRSVQVHPGTRIIAGTAAKMGQLPWQAALFFDGHSGRGLCGGSLISDRIVLTAAHCVYGLKNIEVLLGGVYPWSYMEYNETSYNFMYHDKYNPVTLENDVALITLPVPVTFSPNIQPIPLPARSHPDLDGKTLRVSGYGKTLTSYNSAFLQFVDLTAINNTVCQPYFPTQVFPTTLCAHGAPIHSTCQGDSGGPLVHYNLHATLVGVFSYVANSGCALGYPTGYARVTSFLDWINLNTGIPISD